MPRTTIEKPLAERGHKAASMANQPRRRWIPRSVGLWRNVAQKPVPEPVTVGTFWMKQLDLVVKSLSDDR